MSTEISYNRGEQLPLFNQKDNFSNALNFLQTIPRWDRRKSNHCLQKDAENAIRVYKAEYNNQEYKISVTGASINKVNKKTGKTESHLIWPSNREERVEAGILKIAASGGINDFNTDTVNGYGCYFSIYALREVTGMNASDIKEAIEIMNKANLEIEIENPPHNKEKEHESWAAPFLPVRYLSKKIGVKNDKCFVVFHPAVMTAIDSLQYRPYLYGKADAHKKGLTSYLHKRLIIRFTYAAENRTYNFTMRRILNDYGILQAEEELTIQTIRNRCRDIRTTLKELVSSDIIMPNFTCKPNKDDNNEICDYVFEVSATASFIKEQKHSSHLLNKIKEKAEAKKLSNNNFLEGEFEKLREEELINFN